MGIDLEALANDLRAAGCEVESMDLADGIIARIPGPDETIRIYEYKDTHLFKAAGSSCAWQEIAPALAIISRHLGAGQPVVADRAALVDMFSGALSRYGLLAGDEQLRPEVADTLIAVVEAAGWRPRAEPGTGETLYRRCPECDGDPNMYAHDANDGTGVVYGWCPTCRGNCFVPAAAAAPPEPLRSDEISHLYSRVTEAVASNDPFRTVHLMLAALTRMGKLQPVAPPEPLSAEEFNRIARWFANQGFFDEQGPWRYEQDPAEFDDLARAVLAALPARFAVPVEGA